MLCMQGGLQDFRCVPSYYNNSYSRQFYFEFCIVLPCDYMLFLLYGMHTERNKKRKYKELCIIANIIVFATTAAVAVSFAILPFGQVKFSFLNSNYNLIIYENRFTGILPTQIYLVFIVLLLFFCTSFE